MLDAERKKELIEQTKAAHHRRKRELEHNTSFAVDCRKTEESLQKNEARWQSLTENSPDIIMTVDINGTIQFINRTVEKVSGDDDVLGTSVYEYVPTECADIVRNALERVFDTGTPESYQTSVKNLEGIIVGWYETHAGPVFDGDTIIAATLAARDITERKQMEEALRESEEQFKNVFNNALVGLYRTTPDGRILMANPALVRMLGYDSFEELARQNLEENFEPRYFRSDFKERIEAEGRIIGLEADWTRRDGTILSIRESAKAVCDGLGNTLYYEGTVEDITERKQAEEALCASEQKYHTLVENLHDIVYSYRPDGTIYYVSPNVQSWVQYTPEEIVGHNFIEFVHPDDRERVLSEYEKTISTGKEFPTIFRLLRKDGSYVYVEELGRILREGYEVVSVTGIVRNITERMEAAEALREREALLKKSQAIAHIGSWELDLVANRLIWSDEVYRMFRLRPHEFDATYEAFLDAVHPDDRAAVDAAYSGSLQEGCDSYEIEHRIVRRDSGEVRVVYEKCEHAKDASGRIVRSVGIVQDVTERREAEEALRESDKRYRDLYDNAPNAYFSVGVDGHIMMCNKRASELLGYTAEEMIGRPVFGLYADTPQEKEKAARVFQQFQTGESTIDEEMQMQKADGSPVWISLTVNPVRDAQGQVVKSRSMVVDITERKLAEKVLAEENNIRTTLIETLPYPTMLIRRDRTIVFANRVAREVGAVVGGQCWRDFGHSEYISDEDKAYINEHKEKPPCGTHCTFCLADDALDNSRGAIVPEIKAFGRLWETHWIPVSENLYLHFALDITELKQAQEILQKAHQQLEVKVQERTADLQQSKERISEQHEFLRNTIESLGYPFYVVDANDKTIKMANVAAWQGKLPEKITCYMLSHKQNKPCNETDHPCPLEDIKKTKQPVIVEHIHYDKDGNPRNVELHCHPIFDNEQNVTQMIEYCLDITERKQAEEVLNESEERLKILFESAPDAIYLNDMEGRFVDGNKAAEELIGYSKAEVIGKNFAETGLLSAEQLPMAVERLKKIAAGDPVRPDEFTLKKKDGSYVTVEVRTFPVRIKDEILSLGIARDITERKRVEEKLIDREAKLKLLASELSLAEERERRRIAAGIHDDIAQKLAMAKFELQSLQASVTDTDVSGSLEKQCQLMDQVVADARSLTFELSNPVLYQVGLEAAVESYLTERIEGQFGIKCKFKSEGPRSSLEEDIRFVLFHAVRELLANVVKHANASTVEVCVSNTEDELWIVVQDDGVGFDPTEIGPHTIEQGGFGLFNIRERLEYLGGNVKIESKRKKGARVTMTVAIRTDAAAESKEMLP